MSKALVTMIAVGALAAGGVVATPSSEIASAAIAQACTGHTDQPHLSSHAPGYVNVVARTSCPGGWVYARVRLYRQRWYGYQELNMNQATGTNYVQVNTSWRCAGSGTYTYVAYSYHTAANRGPLTTRNSARFTC